MPFEFVKQDQYLILTLKGECTGNEEPSVEVSHTKEYLTTQLKFLIVQCSECGGLGPNFLRGLAMVYKKLKEVNGKLCLINVNPEIRAAIQKAGLDRLLVIRESMRGALVEFGLAKAKEFDVNFINPFINAAHKVLSVQCSTEAKPQKPFVKKPTDPLLLGDISGLIGITSETFNGTLAISFPAEVFLKLASGMLGQEYKEISQEIVDLAGELSNMILGQAKIELNTLGYKLAQAIPSCVWGKDHQIKHFGGGACIVVPFETPTGIFHIEIMSNSIAASLPK